MCYCEEKRRNGLWPVSVSYIDHEAEQLEKNSYNNRKGLRARRERAKETGIALNIENKAKTRVLPS